MEDLLVIDDPDESPSLPEPDYLAVLAFRLKGLIEVLRRIEQAAVAHYCRLIANTMDALVPLYRLPGVLPRGSVDRDESGFPCTEDLLFLFSEWQSAEKTVQKGVDEAQLLARLRRKVFSGQFPTEEHATLARLGFLSRIRGSELAEDFRMLNPLVLKETQNLRFIRQGWRGWDERAGVFRHYFAFYAQQRGARPFERIAEESFVCRQLREGFQRPLAELLEPLCFRKDAQPKSLDRFTIGPYMVPSPGDGPALRQLFHDLDDPFLLKLTLERVIIESGLPRSSLLDELLGDQEPRPASLREQRTRYVLCSPDVAPRLDGMDEKGEPATVYVMDRRGKIRS